MGCGSAFATLISVTDSTAETTIDGAGTISRSVDVTTAGTVQGISLEIEYARDFPEFPDDPGNAAYLDLFIVALTSPSMDEAVLYGRVAAKSDVDSVFGVVDFDSWPLAAGMMFDGSVLLFDGAGSAADSVAPGPGPFSPAASLVPELVDFFGFVPSGTPADFSTFIGQQALGTWGLSLLHTSVTEDIEGGFESLGDLEYRSFTLNLHLVPEPEVAALIGLGLLGIVWARRRPRSLLAFRR